jgi:hypothetical protein
LRQVDLRPGGSFLVDDLNFRMKTRPVVHCGTRLNSMSSWSRKTLIIFLAWWPLTASRTTDCGFKYHQGCISSCM